MSMSSERVRPRFQLSLFSSLLAIAAFLLPAPRARAFDFLDGRLQLHGYFEEQIRALDKDFHDSPYLAQWYNVFSLETEMNWAPDGWGPFDVLSSYARVEVRYDCVWTRACGMFPSVNQFGDRVERLPHYKNDGRRSGFYGTSWTGNQILYLGDQSKKAEVGRYTELKYEPVVDPRSGIPTAVLVRQNPRRPSDLDQIDGLVGLFAISGANGIFEANGNVSYTNNGITWSTVNDDPAYFYFKSQLGCKFGARKVPGGADGLGNQVIGPINPDCDIQPNGALKAHPNPYNPADWNPLVIDPNSPINGVAPIQRGGSAELPARPASVLTQAQEPLPGFSQGAYYPSGAFKNFLQQGKNTQFDENFTQAELEWNHGGSQQDEYEFKEGYFDMEFFDSRLWVRAGKQNIVWGKTELFRTTDQFNPQDLALASLPSLEESRIALWSVRGVWSFYDVGPLEDVRLEVAANIDDFEPADIGRCGEPFTALVACNKTTALWAHGLTGYALAGEHRPPNWWDSASGLEYGARLEFRYGRFSFQVSDFYGYDDFPFVNRINSFERNVDPNTGRPRGTNSNQPCITGYNPGCLPIQSNFSIGPADPNSADPLRNSGAFPANPAIGTPASRQDVVNSQTVNEQLYTMICATSIGFNSIDRSVCAQSIFNSSVNALTNTPGDPTTRKTTLRISALLSEILAGNRTASTVASNVLTHTPIPVVPLNVDPCDAFLSNNMGGCTNIPGRTKVPFAAGAQPGLNDVLTDEQEALLGCGPFYGTDCESDGIDLLNTEASVVMQSFIGMEGNYGGDYVNCHYSCWFYGKVGANGVPLPQPGTFGFQGGPVALRYQGGQSIKIVGARGPADPGYNVNVDGSIAFTGPKFGQCPGATNLSIPCNDLTGAPLANGGYLGASGQIFTSEMAALSFNFQSLLVAFSVPSAAVIATGIFQQTELNPNDPFSHAPNQCSFAQPQFCSNVKSFFSISGAQRNAVRAGGSLEFGRRDFVWDSGGEGVLQYQKRNVFGLSADFAEDTTKSNWGVEATWIEGNRFTDNNTFEGQDQSDTINMTVSVDRPTFINFLNPNRTFFFNSQVFFQYITNYQPGFVVNGPFNMLGTFTIQTGYFQDRLLPGVTFVYDVNSNSGAALPSVTYRFTENFSATIGMNFFWGRNEFVKTPIAPLGVVGNEVGRHAYQDGIENALAVVRERDEAFLRIRYTF